MKSMGLCWIAAGGLVILLAGGCASTPETTRTQKPVVMAVAPTLVQPQPPAVTPPPVQVQPEPVAPPVQKSVALEQFMNDRPAEAEVLQQHPALEQWFETEWNRPAAYPIIWDNHPPRTSPVAENSSNSKTHFTSIRVSPTLAPVDQLMGLFYETCNAEGRPRINALSRAAAMKLVSREEFTEGIAEAEYGANLRLRTTFPQLLPLAPDEMAHDILYQNMLQVPPTYAEYRAWNIRTHNMTYVRAQELYSREYDDLVRRGLSAMPPPQAVPEAAGHGP